MRVTQISNEQPALLTATDLVAITSMCRSKIYGLIREGSFPAPIKLGTASRWLRSEVEAWITEQFAQRKSGRND